jgi:hypothetical protein
LTGFAAPCVAQPERQHAGQAQRDKHRREPSGQGKRSAKDPAT